MANYYAVARSNYFKVKDEAAFRAWAKSRQLGVWNDEKAETGNPMFGIYSDAPDSDGWPRQAYDEGNDDFVYIDVQTELAEHLAEGAVAVLMEAGSQGLRYLVGYAIAINGKGESVEVNLRDIYKAAESLGQSVTKIGS